MEFCDEFGVWWEALSPEEQEDIDSIIRVLQEKGPSLRRPYTGPIVTSRHSNMKELIVQHAGRPYRILYAFDPRRCAILLLGGDKTGNSHWYDEFVPVADRLYDAHLVQLHKEGLI